MTSPDEHRLDPAAVAALFQQHGEEIRRFLVGVLRDHHLAADALQATFTKLTQVGHTAREESLKGWLFSVAYNEALVLRRRQGVESRATQRLAAVEPPAAELPEQTVARRETAERVRLALANLPAEQREVVRLRMYEQKKFAEIAKALNVPLGTVLTRMQLALGKLRKCLKDET